MADVAWPMGPDIHLSDAGLRALIENAPDGIFVADIQGRYVYANEAGCRMLGYSREEIVGKTIIDLISADEIPRLARSKAAMLEGGTDVDEWILRRKDGSWVSVEVHANILPNGQWQGFVRDISERKTHQVEREALFRRIEQDLSEQSRLAQAVRDNERLLRGIFEILPVGVWIADKTGRIVSNNPAAERIWGGARYVPAEQFGEYKGWWADSGKPIAADEWALTRALTQGKTTVGELVRIQCFDGTFRTIINSAAPLADEKGDIGGAIVANEDITALHLAQEQLRTAVRDREEILAVVAHDLRNPLNSLTLLARTAEMKAHALPGGERMAANAAAIVETVRGMSSLVEDLLAIAVAGPGRSMLKIEPAAAASLVARAADMASVLFERKGVRLQVEPHGGLPAIQVDANRILRVFANLLDNALKFTEPSGRTVVSAEALSGAVRFCIANSGPALPPEALEQMFQPFWQAGHADRRGAGLGLSICRSIVEAHGGSIWAEPAAGMRVRVCFLLPCTGPEVKSTAA